MKRILVIGILIGAIAGSCVAYFVMRGQNSGRGYVLSDGIGGLIAQVTPDGGVYMGVESAWLLATNLATDHDLYAAYKDAKDQSARVNLVYLLVLSGNDNYYQAVENAKEHDWREVQVWIHCVSDKTFKESPQGKRLYNLLFGSQAPNAQIWVFHQARPEARTVLAARLLDPIVARHDQWSVRAASALRILPDRERDALLYLCDTAVKGGEDGRAAVGAMALGVGDPSLDKLLSQYLTAPSKATLEAVVAAIPEYAKRLAAKPTTAAVSPSE